MPTHLTELKIQLLTFIAKFFSVFLHPIAIPTIVTASISIFYPVILLPIQREFLLIFNLFIFISTWLIPSICIYGLFLINLITDLTIDKRRDRMLAIASTTLIYFVAVYFIQFKFRLRPEFMILFYSSLFCLVLSLVVTFFWKISLHATANWGAVAYIITIVILSNSSSLLLPTTLLILLSGIAIWSRLFLQKHDIYQIIGGIVLSSFASFFSYVLAFVWQII